jgi:RHS repeat-associated protein
MQTGLSTTPLCACTSRFTGKERDTESGNDYFGARYYSSSMGRFLSPDQLGGHLYDPQTLNKYSYVRNNPLSLTDPTGLDFSLSCAKDNGTTCQGGTVHYQDKNGDYQQTLVHSDDKGNLSDQSGNKYSANVSGSGVTFTGNGGTNVAGTFVNGTNATTINGSGALSGFTFNFTYSETNTGISAGGTFTYAGNADSAAKALNAAGFTHYWEDKFNGEHPSVKGVYNAVDYRSAGDPNNGAGSGHFTLHVPVGPGGPSSVGDLHLGEHNPYTTVPGFLDHAGEVIRHHMDQK